MGKEKRAATLEELRRIAEAAEGEPELLTLPRCGVEILVRRPSSGWFLLKGRPPAQVVAVVQGMRPDGPLTEADVRAAGEWIQMVCAKVIVEPRDLVANLDVLFDEDRNAIIKFALEPAQADPDPDFIGIIEKGQRPDTVH